MSNSVQRENFNFYFSRASSKINKTFILGRRMDTKLLFEGA